MRERFLNFCLVVCALLASAAISRTECLGQLQHPPSPAQEESLKNFLRDYVGTRHFEAKNTTQYFSAVVHLEDDRTDDIIVYLTGSWCGSGGCTALVLAPKGSSYRIVTKITIARPPIRVLVTKSKGWHDIAVRVQGGGIAPGYEARLPFDGKTYPSNPSMPPAVRLTEKVTGEVSVPPTAKGVPLYP